MIGEKTPSINTHECQSHGAECLRLPSPRDAPFKLLFTEDEVAAMLSLSTSTVRNRYDPKGRWRDDSFPEPRSLDGSGEGRKAAIRWHRDDLLRWADNLPRVSEMRQLNTHAKTPKFPQTPGSAASGSRA